MQEIQIDLISRQAAVQSKMREVIKTVLTIRGQTAQ